MAVIQTDTTNYFSAAVEDDREVEASSSSRPITPPPVSEADAKTARRAVREKRIAAAVERSKLEYKREHVYTERGVSASCPSELFALQACLSGSVISIMRHLNPIAALLPKLINSVGHRHGSARTSLTVSRGPHDFFVLSTSTSVCRHRRGIDTSYSTGSQARGSQSRDARYGHEVGHGYR